MTQGLSGWALSSRLCYYLPASISMRAISTPQHDRPAPAETMPWALLWHSLVFGHPKQRLGSSNCNPQKGE